jgi:exopolysaccharide production protein ExoZ
MPAIGNTRRGLTNMTAASRTALHSVQLLRAVAALAVVLFHTQQSFARDVSPPAFPLESYLFEFGAVGVHVFFVISGLVMVITTYGKSFSLAKFLRRRILRIYPIYWICAAIYVLAYALIGEGYDNTPGQWAGALLLLPGDSSRIIGPGWTLAYEMYFYLAFALTMAVSSKTRRISQTGALIVLAGVFLGAMALGALLSPENEMFQLITNVLLVEFLAGTAIGWLVATSRLPLRWGGLILAAAFMLYLGFIVVGFDATTRVVTMGVPSFLLVLGVVCLEKRYGARPVIQRLARLGDSSYALYLIHIIAIALLLRLANALALGDVLEPAIVALCLAVPLVAVGEFLHRLIELPLLHRLNRGRSRMPKRQPAETTTPVKRKPAA